MLLTSQPAVEQTGSTSGWSWTERSRRKFTYFTCISRERMLSKWSRNHSASHFKQMTIVILTITAPPFYTNANYFDKYSNQVHQSTYITASSNHQKSVLAHSVVDTCNILQHYACGRFGCCALKMKGFMSSFLVNFIKPGLLLWWWSSSCKQFS